MEEENKINKATQASVQTLVQFVDFIASFKDVTQLTKEKAKEVTAFIKKINNPETHKNWDASLEIFDAAIRNGVKKDGIYSRTWVISFANEYLNIEAESRHTLHPLGDYDDHFSFYGSLYFGKEIKKQRVFLKSNISEFIEDAMHYKKYMTSSLDSIEVDIAIY